MDDVGQIRALDRQVLPVRYGDDFYAALSEEESPMIGYVIEEEATSKVVGVATGFLKKKATDWLGFGYGDNFLIVFYLGEPFVVFVHHSFSSHWHLWQIGTFCILPSHQRRGLGSWLYDNVLLQVAAEYSPDLIFLHVKSDNVSAISLYKQKGLKTIKFKPKHYSIKDQRHDAIKMGHSISDKGKAHLEATENTWSRWLYGLMGMDYDQVETLMVDET